MDDTTKPFFAIMIGTTVAAMFETEPQAWEWILSSPGKTYSVFAADAKVVPVNATWKLAE